MRYLERNILNNEEYMERFELVCERLQEIKKAPEVKAPYADYFATVADFVLKLAEVAQKKLADPAFPNGEEGAFYNKLFYTDLLNKEAYEKSYFNPTYAVSVLGEDLGAAFACVYTRLRQEIPHAYEGDLVELCLKAEMVVELYVLLLEEDATAAQAKEVISSYMHDNIELIYERDMNRRFDPDFDFETSILLEADLSTPDYMYAYGQYVGPNELGSYKFLSSMPQEQLQAMADTYTEGFRIGFLSCNKPLEKKTFCDVIYPIGFEPMMRLAAANFKKMNLDVCAVPEGTTINKQYSNDHEKDLALWLDKSFVERALEATKNALAMHKERAPKYAGPAVVETFGEVPFEPESREANLKLDKKQQELSTQLMGQRYQLLQEAIHGDERSFTIISYPIPEIGEKFEEIFAQTVKVNTLDYTLYQNMQQKLIDVLDTAKYVKVKGKGKNKTDIKVMIYPLADPAKETAFENCVADVNIPVGEVFTSPVLEGTEGKLHVTQVYLEGRNFLNLELDFKDGKITNYTCTNFEKEEDNKRYIEDRILFNHPTLPIGEFAIGTNTTAYRMGIEYDIQAKLPILIAEKTGPHFAVGDTCYSFDEDNETFNPDGKKIVARDNSISILRKEDPSKAYFSCHTDITIPYNELKSIVAVAADGTETPVILDGKFVVPGTEELNVPLEGLF